MPRKIYHLDGYEPEKRNDRDRWPLLKLHHLMGYLALLTLITIAQAFAWIRGDYRR